MHVYKENDFRKIEGKKHIQPETDTCGEDHIYNKVQGFAW